MFKHLKFASIPVADQDRALSYYTEKLGFTLKKDEAYGQERWLELSLSGTQTSYFLLEKDADRLQRSPRPPWLELSS